MSTDTNTPIGALNIETLLVEMVKYRHWALRIEEHTTDWDKPLAERRTIWEARYIDRGITGHASTPLHTTGHLTLLGALQELKRLRDQHDALFPAA